MPADFRLIGATTRSPEELPPALRSRCMEVFFRPLKAQEVTSISAGAALRAGYDISTETACLCGRFALCGRDAADMVQMAAGLVQMEKRREIGKADMEFVIESGHYAARPEQLAAQENRVGAVHGLGVYGANQGAVMEIEAVCLPGSGQVRVTGIVEQEELGSAAHTLRRSSMARNSADSVATVLRRLGCLKGDTDVHINFPGGAPVDGPSAGVAMAVAAVSALTGKPVDGSCAITGEIGVQGQVRPVGGVPEKGEAAIRAGLLRVFIPRENMLERFESCGAEIVLMDTLEKTLGQVLLPGALPESPADALPTAAAPLAAQGAEQ